MPKITFLGAGSTVFAKNVLGDVMCSKALRTAPVMQDFARDIEQVCPDAWFLNYTNPMSILTGVMLQGTPVKTVGLCHSVQTCVPELLENLGMTAEKPRSRIAGINHQRQLMFSSPRSSRPWTSNEPRTAPHL